MSITIRDLSVNYDKKRVLANIFLTIEPAKHYGIIGPNGAGKSTLFKAILGLVVPNSGEILIDGQVVEHQLKRIAYIPQKNDIDWQFPATVLDVVMMGRYPHKKVWQRLQPEDKAIALESLHELGIEHLKDRQIGELSGGQQQRMFIARALCQKADYLILDEPFVGVDAPTEEKIIFILKKLISEKKTILTVHHDLATAAFYFDKVILINQRLIAEGDVKVVLTPHNIEKTFTAQSSILHKIGELGIQPKKTY